MDCKYFIDTKYIHNYIEFKSMNFVCLFFNHGNSEKSMIYKLLHFLTKKLFVIFWFANCLNMSFWSKKIVFKIRYLITPEMRTFRNKHNSFTKIIIKNHFCLMYRRIHNFTNVYLKKFRLCHWISLEFNGELK